MRLTFETEQEDDGRWLAEVPEIAGAAAYGDTRDGECGVARLARACRTHRAR